MSWLILLEFVFEILLLAPGCVSTECGDFMYINDCFTVIAMAYSKWHQYLYKRVDVFNYHKWRYTDAMSHILKSTAVRG